MKKNRIDIIFKSVDMNMIRFLPLLEDFFEGVIITDGQGRVLFINNEQARIDDLKPHTLLGEKVNAIYSVDDGDSPIMKCIKSKQAVKGLACYYRTWTGKVVNSIHNVFPCLSTVN